mmetsp:Transcript_5216/g.15362  ORF Transcript_5216/g.15362 Transcript_5216/m.15362 type:complete len:294 (+) Transcript_5216:72-953(+)
MPLHGMPECILDVAKPVNAIDHWPELPSLNEIPHSVQVIRALLCREEGKLCRDVRTCQRRLAVRNAVGEQRNVVPSWRQHSECMLSGTILGHAIIDNVNRTLWKHLPPVVGVVVNGQVCAQALDKVKVCAATRGDHSPGAIRLGNLNGCKPCAASPADDEHRRAVGPWGTSSLQAVEVSEGHNGQACSLHHAETGGFVAKHGTWDDHILCVRVVKTCAPNLISWAECARWLRGFDYACQVEAKRTVRHEQPPHVFPVVRVHAARCNLHERGAFDWRWRGLHRNPQTLQMRVAV